MRLFIGENKMADSAFWLNQCQHCSDFKNKFETVISYIDILKAA